MWKYVKKYWIFCILTAVGMMGEAWLELLQPDMMRIIVDEGVMQQNLPLIVSTGLKMVALVFCGASGGMLAALFSQIVSQNAGNQLRKDFFRKTMNLSFSQIDKVTTGSLITRISSDINLVQTAIVTFLRGVVRSSLLFFGGLIMIYRQSTVFGMIVTGALPFVLVILLYFSRKAAPMFAGVQRHLDKVNSVMDENVTGSRVVKAYVKEDYEIGRFDEKNEALCQMNRKVQKFLAYINPAMNILFNLCVVLILYAGGQLAQGPVDLHPGQIMASLTYVAMIMGGMMFLANIFQTLTRSKASFDRVQEVLSMEDGMEFGSFAEETEEKGSVEFSHVSFRYPGQGEKPVLEDISLSVRPGETIAIIGSTGSGKSSLVHLIPRFYDADSGEIRVDGIPVREYTRKALRDKIAIVLQSSEVYSGSIRDNIGMSCPEAGEEAICTAAQIAQAEDFILTKEDGYNCPVSRGGHSLSGGQKQRLSIARAVLKKAEILILDDATSALDTKTEAEFYRALKRECPGSTKIIIGQRISTVRQADRIFVLENGRIAASGAHEELVRTSPIYQDICLSQTKRGDATEYVEN